MEQQSKAPQDIRNVVNFLRGSSAGIKIRVGVLNGKRIDYFKGASQLSFSLSAILPSGPLLFPEQARPPSRPSPPPRTRSSRMSPK